MAIRIVQPHVKNADGSYDELKLATAQHADIASSIATMTQDFAITVASQKNDLLTFAQGLNTIYSNSKVILGVEVLTSDNYIGATHLDCAITTFTGGTTPPTWSWTHETDQRQVVLRGFWNFNAGLGSSTASTNFSLTCGSIVNGVFNTIQINTQKFSFYSGQKSLVPGGWTQIDCWFDEYFQSSKAFPIENDFVFKVYYI